MTAGAIGQHEDQRPMTVTVVAVGITLAIWRRKVLISYIEMRRHLHVDMKLTSCNLQVITQTVIEL